ncbi:DNA-binding transcriptional regulator, MarR family [Clostridium cavendishii DSM 21758]|uniref:DNA-binding transcriptional regulator, MarR family n=1 Tax=Clostridium cavendishii DSM 21758 TaxID=1121302 RepID=A0A1M6D6V7_9CLOT|nr:MarR family transcriptional regulator [Clostridium cavendishii]SHI68929.1 DNA-binding transcriptional regulator, MarR family [Clostridium cavendishii DSM 21758]
MRIEESAQNLRSSIVELVRSLSILDKTEASGCSISLAQCHAILEIGRAEEVNLNELAEILKLDKSTMSRTVENIVRKGYAQRIVDNKNRKYVKITLTEDGNKIFNETEKNMNEYYKDILLNIDERKRMQVLESLNLLNKSIKDIKKAVSCNK